MSNDLEDRVRRAVHPGDIVSTLAQERPNWIVEIQPGGILVETRRSRERGSGPQLVPSEMIALGWERLESTGFLTNQMLLTELNVKRSAFICALLARFEGVEVVQLRPITLRFAAV